MTLCIAALCQEQRAKKHYIVLCSDFKVGTWAARAEIGLKVRWARAHWPALISGDLSRCEELVKTLSDYLNGVELDSHNVFDHMKAAAAIFRHKLADEIVQRNFCVSYDYLIKNKGKFPAIRVRETYDQIAKIDSGADIITAGFIGEMPHLLWSMRLAM